MLKICGFATSVLVCSIILVGCNNDQSAISQSETPEQIYDLGSLVNEDKKIKPPSSITAQVVALNKEGLKDDEQQELCTDEDGLLGVIPINLNDDGITDYLVYPGRYLPTFFGAHSIACWIFIGNRDETYELVLKGRHDEVAILPTKTNGYRDIDLIYGAAEQEVYSFRYDGHRYVAAPR